MNAADDKENNRPPLNKPTEMNNRGSLDVDKYETKSQIKLNGSSHQTNESNDQITALNLSNGINGLASNDEGLNLPSTSNCINCLPNRNHMETTQTESSNRETEDQPLRSSDSNLGRCHMESENQPSRKPVQNQCHAREVSNYDGNSSSEDEECCIYTYKGDSTQSVGSFFRLDSNPPRPNNHSGNSSPEMDYLEMDFDPGPSNGKDSSSSSECGEEMRDEGCFPENFLNPVNDEEALSELEQEEEVNLSPPSPVSTPSPLPAAVHMIEAVNQPGSSAEPLVVSLSFSTSMEPDLKHDLPQSYCSCVINTFSTSIDENFNDGEAGTMVMKERDAEEKQIKQIGPSASGATAVINALIALDVPYSPDNVERLVATRLRDEQAPLPEYLMSRSSAGSTHEDVIRGLQGISHDLVYARFFPTFPPRSVALTSWLSHWIRKGAVPILTLNAQQTHGYGPNIADSWQHRTVYGVSSRGVHLTNPLETVVETSLRPQLASPPTLLVRRSDVLARYTPSTNLHQLIDPTLPDWRRLNVLGQVAHVIRESMRNFNSTPHVRIPCSWSCGVTLAMLRSNAACEELRSAPELTIDPFAAR